MWHRDPAGLAESHFRSLKRPPSTTGGTSCIIPGRPGTELLGGMLGFPVGADGAPHRTAAQSVGSRDPVSYYTSPVEILRSAFRHGVRADDM